MELFVELHHILDNLQQVLLVLELELFLELSDLVIQFIQLVVRRGNPIDPDHDVCFVVRELEQ